MDDGRLVVPEPDGPDGLPLIEQGEPCPLCKGTGLRRVERRSLRERISLPGIRLH